MPAAARTSTARCAPRLSQLQDSKRPNYVIFLTDGLPTAGETNEMKIVANAKEVNKVHARIFTFGVGYDVNGRLLDKLVRENFGQSEYVRPNEDIEDRVSKLYNRIESPVMTGVQLQFVFDEIKTEEGNPINRVYPEGFLRPVRRRATGGGRALPEAGHGQGGRRGHGRRAASRSSTSPPRWSRRATTRASPSSRSSGPSAAWAKSSTSWTCKGKNDELVKELVELATRHGILTPYTSFMADDGANIHDWPATSTRAGAAAGGVGAVVGRGWIRAAGDEGRRSSGRPKRRPRWQTDERQLRRRVADRVAARQPSTRALPPKPAARPQAAEQNVRNVGNRTFFRRDGQWVDSQVTKAAAAQRPADQAVQRRVFRAGPHPRPAALAVSRLRRAGAAESRQPGVPDRAVRTRRS